MARVELLFVLILLSTLGAMCDEHSHKYKDEEEVVLWMNTVGPYHNRQETYGYYSLPFCRGSKKKISHYHETFAEGLQGVELQFSGLDIKFKQKVPTSVYCSMTLQEGAFNALEYAVRNRYWYQMFIDDLPIWGIVGEASVKEKSSGKHFVWTHKKFEIGYNGDQIVDVNMTSETKVELKKDATVSFSYEVIWKPSTIQFKNRYEKYLDHSFFQHRIHWFSIFNSFMMVIFLVGLVSMILIKTLKRDFARYNKEQIDLDDIEQDLGDEYGWKQVHGDVFRPPPFPMILSALVGLGYHLAVVTLLVILVVMMGDLYTGRGSILSTALVVYVVCTPVSGFVGGSLYSRYEGRDWIKQMALGAFLFPGVVCASQFFLNLIALYYGASRAIPFTLMLSVVALCLFAVGPLSLVGTVLGRSVCGHPNNPCRISPLARAIPEKKWFMEPAFVTGIVGLIPFGSIFIEMYFIFSSFWEYKIYYVYGFMLLVFLILVIVTVCVTIVAIYFVLNGEDSRWQWRSFMSAASTSAYVYLYCIYYFFFKTKMYGLFQTTFYFGYMALFSMSLGVMCGTFGYVGTAIFVRKIYAAVKID